jgi:predicted transcriptional regulator
MAFKVKMPQNSFKKDLFLTEIRKKLGITKVQLASILKVSRSYVSLVELKNGKGIQCLI